MYKFTSENIRKAIAWRSTEEAKPILSQKSKKAWNNRAAKKCICKRCGSEFESRMDKLAFWCSNKCKKDQHYEDNQIIRKCKMCDKEFRVYRYSETFTCSRTCAGMHSHLRRKKNVADKQSNITGN